MKGNLLKVVAQLRIEDIDKVKGVIKALESRLMWLEDREPESDGDVWDAWSDKRDELEEIVDNLEDFISLINEENKTLTDEDRRLLADDRLESSKEMLEDYQDEHGGLSRLTVEW